MIQRYPEQGTFSFLTCLQVKVNLGGPPRIDEDGNVIPGRLVDMVVEGSNVYLVSKFSYDGGLRVIVLITCDLLA